jgi:hypothetical protein
MSALRLAARKGESRLPEFDVLEPHIEKCLEHPADLWVRLEKSPRFLHVHVQNVGDGFALVLHLQRLAVVALAAAIPAPDPDIR